MRLSTRWAVPSALAATLLSGSLVVPALANADPELPPTTARELLADVAGARAQSLSGTVVQTVDLGLPQLPHTGPGASELSTLLGGSTTLRVWSDGADRSRVAVLGTLAETDVVRNGQDVFLWRSDSNTAVHATMPEDVAGMHHGPATLPSQAPTPQEAAEWALSALEPSTAVSVPGTVSVAGRAAYELTLEPRDAESLVGTVRIAVDAETSYPLRVQVVPRGAGAPAFDSGFTQISFTAPADDVFQFSPPQGASVREVRPEDVPQHAGQHHDMLHEHIARLLDHHRPTVVGEGWTAVLVVRNVDPAALSELDDPQARSLVDAFQPVQGPYGTGRLFTSPLFSVLWLDDGRLLVGAVGPDVLERVALDPRAAAAAPAAAPR